MTDTENPVVITAVELWRLDISATLEALLSASVAAQRVLIMGRLCYAIELSLGGEKLLDYFGANPLPWLVLGRWLSQSAARRFELQ